MCEVLYNSGCTILVAMHCGIPGVDYTVNTDDHSGFGHCQHWLTSDSIATVVGDIGRSLTLAALLALADAGTPSV